MTDDIERVEVESLDPGDFHDSRVDKHGRRVSRFISEAVETLRQDPRVAKVICDSYKTGRLQLYFSEKYVQGKTLRLARELGYGVDFATTRDGDLLDQPSWSTVGYTELIPEEHIR